MLAAEQSFGAHVFVEVGPLYSIASPAYLKLSAFRGCSIREAVLGPDENGNKVSSRSIVTVSSVTSTFKTLANVTTTEFVPSFFNDSGSHAQCARCYAILTGHTRDL